MCLAIPGKLITVAEDNHGVRMGRANFGGIVKEVCLQYTPEAGCGDYVLVHVGFALSKVDEEEARRTYEALESLNQLGELQTPGAREHDGPPESIRRRMEDETEALNLPGSANSAQTELP